jgi:hypothetical protein
MDQPAFFQNDDCAITKQPLIPKGGDDCIFTPDSLAIDIVSHFASRIYGTILEPSAGDGAFVRAFQSCGFTCESLELKRGQDFFDYKQKVDWIITNPPWSKMRAFLKQAYLLADNIIFLVSVNHVIALRARLRDMENAGFGISEIVLCDTPKDWPQSGFQLGASYIKRGYKGPLHLTHLGHTLSDTLFEALPSQ